MSQLLKRWYEIHSQIKQLEKEENLIKEKIKSAMVTKGLTQVRGGDYRVSYRQMTRESLSKKDCPVDVWSKYCKKSSFHVMKIENIGESNEDQLQD